MGQTLFQRLIRGAEPVEFKHFNPAKAKIGSSFSLDIMDMRDLMFTLREIWEYKRTTNGKTLTFGDYVLLARPLGKEDVSVRVRFAPSESPDVTHDVMFLTKYDSMRFCKELDEAVRCGSGELEITDEVPVTYYRPLVGDDRITESFRAEVNVVKDINGKVGVETGDVEYWDYSRITKDEAGQNYEQYLFVELDQDKVQTIWRGEMIDPERVTVL